MKWAVPLVLANFTFTGTAADLPLPRPMFVQEPQHFQFYAKCYISPRGLTNPRWTTNQKFFEGMKCWHSTAKSKPAFLIKPIPKPNFTPNQTDQLFQQYEQWLDKQQLICLGLQPGQCYK